MSILACIDRSRYTTSICDHAIRAARRLGTGVDLLHAIDWQPTTAMDIDRSGLMSIDMTETALQEFSEANEARNREAHDQAQSLLDEAATYVRAAGIEPVRERIVFGNVVDHLGDFDAETDLIVVGKRGEREGHASNHLGSNLERIVRATHHPVLIVPPEIRELTRFVVAYDASSSSMKALDMLTRQTLLLEAECHLLMVAADTQAHRAQLDEGARRLADAGYRVESSLRNGNVEDVIAETIETLDAQLLVMGAYGHSRVREMIIGSTTTALLRSVNVPVLVVR